MSDHDVSTADLPGKQDAGGWRTLHPLTPFLRGGLFIIVLAGIIVANLRDQVLNVLFGRFGAVPPAPDEPDESGEEWSLGIDVRTEAGVEGEWTWLLFAGGIVLVLLVIGLALWFDWRMKTFRVTDDAVESRSGILVKKYRRAPLDRVQGINLQRPLLARIVGLTTLEVATAGSDGKVSLSYLSHRDAKDVRAIILQRVATKRHERETLRGDVHVNGLDQRLVTPGSEATSPLSRRLDDFADLDLDPATRSASIVTVPAPRLIGSTLLSWEVLVPIGLFFAALVLGAVVGRGFLFLLIPFIVIAAGSWFSSFTKGMNFHLSETSDGVRVASGLLSTVTDTIPRGRIHAVEVRQPLFWRLMGWWQVRVTTAGLKLTEAGQSGSKNIMLPVGKQPDALRVVDVLLPDHGLEVAAQEEALVGRDGPFFGSPGRARVVLLWGRKRNGVLLRRAARERVGMLMIRRGWFTRQLIIVPVERFQSLGLKRGVMHRMLGLASLESHTVLGPTTARVTGLDLPDAKRLFDEIQSHVLEVQLGSDGREAE